ncbi:MAG TPA: sialidase family protein [Bdellovibrionota bacterium]|nr:sialidase family protein [Bdellovibrionota bacterium]
MAHAANGDLYYAFSQSMYVSDPAEPGLPSLRVRVRTRSAGASAELVAPPVAATATTASLLALRGDAAGNLYLLFSTYRLATDTTSYFLYRYAAGETSPTLRNLPAPFILSNRTGAGFHVDAASGKLWLAGTRFTSTSSFAAAASSGDGGATWTVRDATAASGSQAFGVTTDSSGNPVLAGAKAFGDSFGTAWTLYRSADGGATFIEKDSFNPTSALEDSASRAEYVAITDTGRIVVAGSDLTDPATAATSVVVRESSDGGESWSERARLGDSSGGFYQARGLVTGQAGTFLPILEGKKPAAFLLGQLPGASIWQSTLSITNLAEGEPYMQAAEHDPSTGDLVLMTNYLKYSARESSLRISVYR